MPWSGYTTGACDEQDEPTSVREPFYDSPSDLGLGFFDRPSTTKYLESLAEAGGINLIAGAGVSADFGAPLWGDMMQALLASLLANTPEFSGTDPSTARTEAARIAGALVEHLTAPAHLGSIARSLIDEKRLTASQLRRLIREVLAIEGASGGFLARGICCLAFSFALSDDHEVHILTTNYDSSIEGEQEYVKQYVDSFQVLSLVGCAKDQPNVSTTIKVVHLNGYIDLPDDAADDFVIGESDFFTRIDANGSVDDAHNWRADALSRRLSERTTLFVGSSLTDPDILEHLAHSKTTGHERYALVMAPELPEIDPFERPVTYLQARNALGRRYEHLGVRPIFVDHYHQVPQFLRELGLRVLKDETYESYTARSRRWWDFWATAFGTVENPRRDPVFLNAHRDRLDAVKTQLELVLANTARRMLLEPEMLALEVWVRNPYTRELMLWCNSEAVWLYANSAHRASLRKRNSGSQYVAQRAFMDGRPIGAQLDVDRGHWRYALSIPLVLQHNPWNHLPIGVVNAVSDAANGSLRFMADHLREFRDIEHRVKAALNVMLDPRTYGSGDSPAGQTP